MNQPTKDALREQLALAADEIIRMRIARDGFWTRLTDEIEQAQMSELPSWARFIKWWRGRIA